MNAVASPAISPIPGLPFATERVFRALADVSALSRFVLIGGTAMALQCRHRLSEDLDFWLAAGRLSDRTLSPVLEAATRAGLKHSFVGPTSAQRSAFRINRGVSEGLHLDELIRDYEIGGVKVKFFVASDAESAAFSPYVAAATTGLAEAGLSTSFRIMPLDGLFAMKSYVIQRRHRSRDVLDLWHFVNAGRTVDEIVAHSQRVSTTATAERAIAVLRGDVPFDAVDVGFRSLAPDVDIERVHADFRVHDRLHLHRRMNVIVYLNEDWRDEYGGCLELWDRDMKAKRTSVLPIFNRCVIFNTDADSYHGHPDPLTCPPEVFRRSLALYYYTASQAIYKEVAAKGTVYHARPQDNSATRREAFNLRVEQHLYQWVPPALQRYVFAVKRRLGW